LLRNEDRPSLFLGLSCLLFAPSAAVFGYDNLLLMAFPDLSFRAMLAVQYLPGALAITFFYLNAHTLFPHESSLRIAKGLVATFIAGSSCFASSR
jgi:hypothetical protein